VKLIGLIFFTNPNVPEKATSLPVETTFLQEKSVAAKSPGISRDL